MTDTLPGTPAEPGMRLHLIHKWSKWGEPFDSALASSKKCQARVCLICGKHQVGYVRSPWNWWFNAKQIGDSLAAMKGHP